MANAAELRNRIVEAALRAERDYLDGYKSAWEEANDLWGATSALLELLTAIKATDLPESNESGFFVGQEWESKEKWQGRTYRIVIERICENNPLAVMARGIGVDAARRMGMRDILRRFNPCSPSIQGNVLPEPATLAAPK